MKASKQTYRLCASIRFICVSILCMRMFVRDCLSPILLVFIKKHVSAAAGSATATA